MSYHFLTALVLSLIIYWIAPNVWIDPRHIKMTEEILIPPEDVVLLSWNKAVKRFENKFIGPESLTHNPDTEEIYTGTAEGMIWRINKDLSEAKPLMRIGKDHKDCGLEHVAHICGRILGLKFLAPDKLIVADAYNGIIVVDLKKLTKEVLVRPDQNMLTRSLKLFNSVDVSASGIVYFTVSSMRWPLHDFIYSPLENDSTGRVYSYNLKTRDLKLIAANIPFANGIAVTPDETGLMVCEIFGRRIYKFNLLNLNEEPKIWIEHLPGFPDNIKMYDSENYYVALPSLRIDSLFVFLNDHPLINRLVAWFVPKWLIMHFGSYNTQVYVLNGQGKIVRIINGTLLKDTFITEAYRAGDKILFGNIHENYVAVMNAK